MFRRYSLCAWLVLFAVGCGGYGEQLPNTVDADSKAQVTEMGPADTAVFWFHIPQQSDKVVFDQPDIELHGRVGDMALVTAPKSSFLAAASQPEVTRRSLSRMT
jgi:hypothetical protein